MDAPFLNQLEHRALQLRTVLHQLEEERARIDSLIGRVGPLIPQYERTIDAERELADLTRTILPGSVRPDRQDVPPSEFLRVAPHGQPAPAPANDLAQPNVGDTVFQADGTALTVEDTSDPALLTVRRGDGAPMKIGRRAVSTSPPVTPAQMPASR